ncbi:MAG: hypothetical protein H7Z21_13060, partial [Hymenobacter sp.]|nr:hypothetical protein [Hymenobacter sp.]
MTSINYSQNNPFDLVTGELLPEYGDAYLLGRLTPVVADQVEGYLKKHSVRTRLLLARYHELAATAQQQGRA